MSYLGSSCKLHEDSFYLDKVKKLMYIFLSDQYKGRCLIKVNVLFNPEFQGRILRGDLRRDQRFAVNLLDRFTLMEWPLNPYNPFGTPAWMLDAARSRAIGHNYPFDPLKMFFDGFDECRQLKRWCEENGWWIFADIRNCVLPVKGQRGMDSVTMTALKIGSNFECDEIELVFSDDGVEFGRTSFTCSV